MPKILIVTDTWDKVDGVVTSILQLREQLELRDFKIRIIHPGEFRSKIPIPTYPELKIALVTRKQISNIIKKESPDYIHIATEGPLGWAARMACVKNKWKFTTYYYTQLPEYIQIRVKAFKKATYSYLRWFHGPAQKVMVTTQSLKKRLEKEGFKNLSVVSLGADTKLFKKNRDAVVPSDLKLKKPVFVYLGRLAPEKEVDVFLKCTLPGSKLVIGDGPTRKLLEREYKNTANFVGYKKGQELVDLLSICDVFVFPSKTDTFGIALVEGLACSLPIAAFDVPGPRDIVTDGLDGYLGDDLAGNAIKCLQLNSENCRKKALQFSAENWAKVFLANLVRA